MALQIQKKQDKRTAHACTHNLADIPNGVTLCSAELVAGGVAPEGAYIAPDAAGLWHLLKTARLVEAAADNAKAYKVAKGHHFKAGDVVTAAKDGKAYAITAIDTTSDPTQDTITLSTTLGVELKEGAALVQAAKAGADGSAYKYEPMAVLGDSYNVEALGNHLVSAVTFGQFKAALSPAAPAELRAALPTVKFI